LRYFNRSTSLAVLFLFSLPNVLLAEENEKQPDEAFLEFLASMADIDGESSDPLDMLNADDMGLENIKLDEKKTDNKQVLVKTKPKHEGKVKQVKVERKVEVIEQEKI